jgi:hypothetical protein
MYSVDRAITIIMLMKIRENYQKDGRAVKLTTDVF